ncbi:hypothetical protein NGA_2017900, partial [Nannochloropsis gaditana CCMP526]
SCPGKNTGKAKKTSALSSKFCHQEQQSRHLRTAKLSEEKMTSHLHDHTQSRNRVTNGDVNDKRLNQDGAGQESTEQAHHQQHGPHKDSDGRPRLIKIVLTGGPCGGKTTSLARLSEFFRTHGFRVFTVPEAATTLWSNGVALADILGSNETQYWFQDAVLDFQIHLEDGMERIARSLGRPSVILCDRGTLDGAAYVSKELWEELVKKKGLELLSIREGRYDAIFHLVTAAMGAEPFYSLLNNVTRTESPEFAREVDMKTQGVWNGHPRHYVIDNSTDFEGKLARVQDEAARLVGLPQLPRGADRWFLRKKPKPDSFTVPFEKTQVRKVYLMNVGRPLPDGRKVSVEYNYVEERSQDGSVAYAHTSKQRLDDGHEAELKRIIDAREFYSRSTTMADPSRKEVFQTRYSFLWAQQAFVVIHHHSDAKTKFGPELFTLRRQAKGGIPEFPPFLDVGEHIEDEDGLFPFPTRPSPTKSNTTSMK